MLFSIRAQVVRALCAIPHLYLEKQNKTKHVHRQPSHLEGKEENRWGKMLKGTKWISQTCIKKLSLILLENPNLPKGLSQGSHTEKNALSSSYE